MTSKATTPEEYLAELSDDRRSALTTVRAVILENLNPGFVEGMVYGHIGYHVPHELYPAGYHCDPKMPLVFASLASQKQHMAVYLTICGADAARRFQEDYLATGKKLDMGVSCVRFKKLENLALDVVGRLIKETTVEKYIADYERARAQAAIDAAERKAARNASKA